MQKIQSKYVWWGILAAMAILIGALNVAPQIFIKKNIEGSGRTFVINQLVELFDGGDTYLQFAREVADGHFPPSDLFFDYSLPNIYPLIPPLIVGSFIIIFGSATAGYVASLFFLPPVLFLLFYWIGQLIFEKNRLWSVFFAGVGILTPFALSTAEAFFGITNFANIILKNFYPGIHTALPLLFYSRVDYPLVTTLLYLPAIACFLIFWQKPNKTSALFTGITAGLLFYTYFHLWVFWVVVIGTTFIASLIFLRKDLERIKGFLTIIAITAIVSVPYFINYFRLKSLPGSEDLIGRLGLEIGSFFRWESWQYYLVYLGFAVLVYWFFWRNPETRLRAILYWSILAAAFIIWNIQIVLGYVPHSDHWPRGINPLVFILFFELVYFVVQRMIRAGKITNKTVIIVLIILAALLPLKKIINATMFISPNPSIIYKYTLPEEMLRSWDWMDKNLGEVKIISPSLTTTLYLTAFTATRPFLPWGGVTAITNQDLENRYLIANKLFEVSPEILEMRLREGRGIKCNFECDQIYAQSNIADSRMFLYQLYYTDPENPKHRDIPDEKIQELLKRYREIRPDWKSLDAGYAYVGPLERQFGDPGLHRVQGLDLVYRNELVEIYKIKH